MAKTHQTIGFVCVHQRQLWYHMVWAPADLNSIGMTSVGVCVENFDG
ncbi:hypothetical protein [Alicyclobacillus ferrooxydans]|nr:hypothetical protein [Alicyclobacillus ferrooxydans]